MSKVKININILKWAIERSEHTLDKLLSKFPKLNEWISGQEKPTFKQLESFSKATKTPFGYMFLNDIPKIELPIPHYRTLINKTPFKPSADLIETVLTMQRRQEWANEYLNENGCDLLEYVSSASTKEDPKKVANYLRKLLNLESNWASKTKSWEECLRLIRSRASDAGIIVVVNGVVGNNTHRKLNVSEFRGFVLIDKIAPLIFINGADVKAAQMFTIAHELAHILVGKGGVFDLENLLASDDPVETFCNQVAAEFLVPENELAQAWYTSNKKLDQINEIANTFRVSPIVVARRCLDLKLINKNTFFKFYNEYIKNYHNRKQNNGKSGGDFFLTQDQRIGTRFAQMILEAVTNNKLYYSEAYRLTGLKGKTFYAYKEKKLFEGFK